jgi:hypothetical protein
MGKINEGALSWKPSNVDNSLSQDDLYVDMTFAEVLDKKGLDATTEDFGEMFKDAKYELWHANLAARRNLRRGISALESGTPKYNAHANDIDFQIESDFIGLMAPGMPEAANELAGRAGRVMNYGDGIYGGMFLSGMYAAAFFETDPRRVVQAGLACLPSKSPYAKVIADVLAWSRKTGDWKEVWRLLEDKWDTRDPCPEGALKPFNIDAKLNGAYIALGLLYGKKDFGNTIEIALRSGQDSDCNPASAGGILGVMLGYKQIPEEWKSGIPAIADKKFDFTEHTFHTIVESTYKRAIALAKQNGGSVEDDKLLVKVQSPKAPRLEIWDDYGSPDERIAAADARWAWKGEWHGSGKGATRIAGGKNAEASIGFNGTGAILCGPYLVSGGKADVYLDGELNRTVDVFPDEPKNRKNEAVWHAFGLKKGDHTLRIVVRGERYESAYGSSKGSDIGIDDLIVFR